MVSIYRARKPPEAGGRKAYCQQQQALLKLGKSSSPDKQFWSDLWEQIRLWSDNGDQLLLYRDWNQDVRKQALLDQFAEFNLVPAIISQHDPTTAPETYSGGREPIDEIFASVTLGVTKAGYLEHGSSQGDHRPIWINVDKTNAMGTIYPEIPSHKARRLKCSDPKVVKRYLKHLDKFYRRHNMYHRCYVLFQSFTNPLSQEQIQEYEKLEALCVKGMFLAKKKCRKLKMGACKWSQQFALCRKRINYINKNFH